MPNNSVFKWLVPIIIIYKRLIHIALNTLLLLQIKWSSSYRIYWY